MTREQIGAVRERYDATMKWLPFLLGDANGLQGFRETIETIPTLLEALEEADGKIKRAIEMCPNGGNDGYITPRPCQCEVESIETDRDHWKARAEALERAIRSVAPRMTPCDLCANWNDDGCLRPESCSIWTPHGKDNWQFDQTRFERGGNDD